MEGKLSLLIVGLVALCYHLVATAPANFRQARSGVLPTDTALDHMARYLESFEPLAISKRAAPVYEPEETKKQEVDLKSSASGYGYGHGGGGGGGGYGHGHGSNSPTGYVSYGAKTGGYGAFSWYSDHPAGTYGYH